MELAVHEVEPGINGTPVDGAEDLLLRRGPLAPPGAKGLVETLKVEENLRVNINST